VLGRAIDFGGCAWRLQETLFSVAVSLKPCLEGAQRLTKYLSPWSRVFLEQLILPELGKRFFPFYETLRFIVAFVITCHVFIY
jgi:hypothetical protein